MCVGSRLGHRQVVEGRVVAQHAERVAVRPLALDARRRGPRHRVGREPPHEQSDARDVVTAAGPVRDRTADVDGVGQVVEGQVEPLQPLHGAQVGVLATAGPLVVQVLGPAEQGEELHGPRRPPGHVGGEELEQRQRALAAAEGQRVRDVAPRHEHPAAPPGGFGGRVVGARVADCPVADEVAEVGHHPVVAGLDEPVVVEPGDVLLHHVRPARSTTRSRSRNGSPCVLVAHPVHGRQQVVEAVR